MSQDMESDTRCQLSLGIRVPDHPGTAGWILVTTADGGGIELRWTGFFSVRTVFSRRAIKDVIAEIRSLTDEPFAMNLWVSMEDQGSGRVR